VLDGLDELGVFGGGVRVVKAQVALARGRELRRPEELPDWRRRLYEVRSKRVWPGIDDKQKEFVAVVLKDTEDVWHEQFSRLGRRYREPKLVLFSEATQSACGFAQSAMGPFYCPPDQRIYLDTSFFRDLQVRFRG
jgi:predicted metalloprotease